MTALLRGMTALLRGMTARMLSRRLARVLAVAAQLVGAIAAPAAADLEVGQPAPEFELQGSDGQTYTLASIFSSGKEGVVLAWFPKAFTPG